MTVSLSKEARYGNYPSSCTPKRPEFGLAYSLGEEFRRLPELQNNTPVLIYAVSLSEAMIVGGMSVLDEIFFENFVYL